MISRRANILISRFLEKLQDTRARYRSRPEFMDTATHLTSRLQKPGLWFGQASAGKSSALRQYFPTVLVALLGIAITILASRQVNSWETQKVTTAFRVAASDRILVVQREVEHTLAMIQDIANFFDASPNIGRREFRKFVEPAIKRYSGIEVLGWIPRVEEAQKAAFIEAARASFPPFDILEMGADGQITEASGRREYFPVLYVQPYKNNRELLGLDMGVNPLFFPLLRQAALSGEVQVVERVTTQAGSNGESAFVVAVPVYYKTDQQGFDESSDMEAVVTDQLRGFAFGIFSIGETVELALRSLSAAGINIRFYRESAGNRELLYQHNSRVLPPSVSGITGADDDRMDFQQQMIIGNQHWEVEGTAVPGRFETDFWSGWIIMMGGIAFVALLTIYIATLVGAAEKVRRLVDQRTLQLRDLVGKLNREIIERKNAEAELQNLNDDLEYWVAIRTSEANRRAEDLEQFAYVTSHDLKAPLRAIANLAEWIGEDLKGKLDEDSQEQLNLLKDRVRRMHGLIEGLLEYSRVGRTEGSYSEVDCGKLLDEIIDSLSPPPSFKIEVQEDMPVFRADRLQLGQVFSNLISNSLKHYRGNKGRIKITVKEQDGFYQFEVLDNGPGIAREYHEKVFKMFQVLETSDYGSNTGIGLALVKKIVQEQGGTITLKSKVGKGARFRFTWPKAPS
jgi:signal transduction histidine kinase